MNFLVLVFDIKDLPSKKQIDEFTIVVDSKEDAQDLACILAEEKFPTISRLIEIKPV